MITPEPAHPRDISSIAIAYESGSKPEPPNDSSTSTHIRPRSPNFLI